MTAEFVCWVHQGRPLPIELVNRHHINPQSVGAEVDDSDENIALLCTGCHQDLTTMARKIACGKTAEAVDIAERAYEDPQTRHRLLQLAFTEAQHRVDLKEGTRERPEWTMVVVSDMPQRLFDDIKVAARAQGLSRNLFLLRLIAAG